MNDSFYGGKQGFSFVIVENYPSIEEMVTNFKLGANYTVVHYDEYVLINTENKNDPDNGKIFRRGYNYINELGGAIYIGTIVGPAGKAPMLELTTIEGVNEKHAEEGFSERRTEGSYKITDESIVPGKEEDGSFNDEIKWACCSIRNPNNEDCTAYIGFQIPYLVIDFSAESVSPYYNRSNETDSFINQNLSERTDDKTHPYFEKWHFNIPKGIKGDTLKNFRVIEATDDIEDYPAQSDDVSNRRQVLVYDYYNYDKIEQGDKTTIYLGDYNMIEDVSVDNEGTIRVQYTHNDDLIYTKMLKWIKSVTLNKNNGHFTVEYNHSTDKEGEPTIYETDLDWVNKILLSEDGTVTIGYSTGKTEDLEEKIKWIENIQMRVDGTIDITYNDGTHEIFDKDVQWIVSVTLTSEGVFTVKYNNGADDYTTNLVWVKDVEIQDNGTIIIHFNNGTNTTHTNYLQVIKKSEIQTNLPDDEEGTGDQKLHITYNTGKEEIIGKPINYIMETAISDNYHYIVRYSDPAKRAAIKQSGKNFTYDGKDDWYDLGSIKDESGILIGLNLSKKDNPSLSTVSNTINYLNATYPQGLTDLLLKGKIVCVGDDDNNKLFYAFDYSKTGSVYKGWFYVGSLTSDMSSFLMIANELDPDYEDKKEKLNVGGIWFIVEE